MTRRRTLFLAVIAAAGVGAFVVVRRRTAPDAPVASAPAPAPAPAPEPVAAPAWVATTDGAAPDGYPVKVNTRSGIFHVPGGRSYDRTVPDRCYATAADAEADGYRRAKA
jgi:hypothetical protein